MTIRRISSTSSESYDRHTDHMSTIAVSTPVHMPKRPWQDFREAVVCHRAPITLRHGSRGPLQVRDDRAGYVSAPGCGEGGASAGSNVFNEVKVSIARRPTA
jgi:hypothetical protein